MMKLIDKFTPRAAIFQALCCLKPNTNSDWLKGYQEGLRAALDIITATEIVEAVPVVHGRWEVQSDGYSDDYWKCSACGEEWFFIEDPTTEYARVNFCPNCGAKMDGGDAE